MSEDRGWRHWLHGRLSGAEGGRGPAWLERWLDWLTARDLQDRQDFADDADWAILEQQPVRPRFFVWLLLAIVLAALVWAGIAQVDEVARGEGKVVPSSQIQRIQSLDGGVVSEILVREGARVQKNQLLLKIDSTRFESSLNENRAQYLSLLAKAARLRAITNGTPFVVPPEVQREAPDIGLHEMELYGSKRRELEANMSIARQQLAQRNQELVEVRARREQAEQGLGYTSKELQVTRPLRETGAVSDVDLLRLERDVSRFRGERDMAAAQIPKIQAAIAEAQRKIEEVELSFRNQASAELSDTLAKLSSLTETRVALNDRVKLAELRSPVNGTVKQLLVNTIGGVVQPGKDIVEIVPTEDTLLLEARILPRDIAFLHPGQKAFVRFTAYDFAIYGGLDATLEQIGADTVTDDKGNAFYVVRVRTRKSYLGNASRPIIPGMVAEVDIMTGKKSILSYLLKPVLRAHSYAMTER
ncbi:HlyD family type I secretion periplasmic adaptor subunit [Pseudogulbenkiania sp. MAI-1]|uniref:HlyD family type I secretion periplasmic adaptor subunit n=1 Tax=Pseudogulbenkiania sp. MAI-1 TaxID=990370 RepID=UPI00045E62C3|nr:HlyD family type I secretion periplasmic adaptor subunit [Pseudogulbenkiania sp. MAI-1]